MKAVCGWEVIFSDKPLRIKNILYYEKKVEYEEVLL